jgi:hypothetical protein
VRTIHPATTARPDSRTRTRRRVVAAACVAVALLAGLGIKLWLDHRVPPPDADAGRLSRYMASPACAALPDAQKAPYLDAVRQARRGGKDPILRYFSTPAGKERERFLDDVIDRVLESEKERKRPQPPDKEGAKEVRIEGRLADAIPPEDRARMDQFLQDLHDRRVARGVPDDGKFLFPGGTK